MNNSRGILLVDYLLINYHVFFHIDRFFFPPKKVIHVVNCKPHEKCVSTFAHSWKYGYVKFCKCLNVYRVSHIELDIMNWLLVTIVIHVVEFSNGGVEN